MIIQVLTGFEVLGILPVSRRQLLDSNNFVLCFATDTGNPSLFDCLTGNIARLVFNGQTFYSK